MLIDKNKNSQIKKILTEKKSDNRLSEVKAPFCQLVIEREKQFNESTTITVSNEMCQTMMGFGGAFTEATAFTLSRISEELRAQVINLYFDKKMGLGYNLGRVPIHSCDFSLENYTYVEDDDKDLDTFSIERDHQHIIPLIHDALKIRGEKIKMLASPWSPPKWMKSNNNMNQGGKLLPEYFESWAKYYVKFIEAYESAGIPIWGLTVQNEPEAVQTWDSCIYTGEEERDFVKNYLGPKLHKNGHADKKILIWDHNRDKIVERASIVLEDPDAAKYVWGTGFHWYESEEFENVQKVHDLFPDKHLLFTEGCQEGGVHIGKWHTGERYGRNMIGDFNSWCEGYLDWNMVLDETGGPNHVGNFCDAPIIADTKTNHLYINSSYYYIGHFSKYVKEGAKRLVSKSSDNHVLSVVFVNPDQTKVVVVMNESENKRAFNVKFDGQYFEDHIDKHAIATYLLTGTVDM